MQGDAIRILPVWEDHQFAPNYSLQNVVRWPDKSITKLCWTQNLNKKMSSQWGMSLSGPMIFLSAYSDLSLLSLQQRTIFCFLTPIIWKKLSQTRKLASDSSKPIECKPQIQIRSRNITHIFLASKKMGNYDLVDSPEHDMSGPIMATVSIEALQSSEQRELMDLVDQLRRAGLSTFL